MNQNSEVVACKTKTISGKRLKRSTEVKGTVESGDNSVGSSLRATAFTLHGVICSIVNVKVLIHAALMFSINNNIGL